MAISEQKMKIVIENYFKAECNVNTSIREAFEKGFRIGVKKASSAQPVIRCKDCIHIHDNDCPISWGRQDFDYCSWAERRHDADNN
jgi:hypothetical protein